MSAAGWRGFGQRIRARLDFPLLTKELTETAARRRTYVLRVVYAILLYALFAMTLPRETWALLSRTASQPNDLRMLGAGGTMFQTLMTLQFMGVLLFLPAMMCGRITLEKERDSLVLLFLTDLGPWGIVLQKYFGGLVSMISFFLLGLPLAGVAYAFGGVDTRTILWSLFYLLQACLFVGAFSLFCSAWCRSTVGAFVMTYLAGAVPVAILLVMGAGLRFFLAPLAIFILLSMSRRFLVSRALVPPVNFLRPLFQRIDRMMKRMNRATGNIELWSDTGHLPGDDPVFWRETHGKVLGKAHYLLRLLCVIEIPTVFLCLVAAYDRSWGTQQWTMLSVLLALLAGLAALLVSVQAANSIVSERVGQSLEVLLTTPLSAREIIRQKERALWRVVLVASVPLFTVVAAEAYAEVDNRISFSKGTWIPYLVCAVSLIVIYLPMITWLSLWISLRVRTRFQAIIAAVGTLTAWAALSPLLFYLTESDSRVRFGTHLYGEWSALVLLSPASMAILNEFNLVRRFTAPFGDPWTIILMNSVLYGGFALLFRWRLYANAESLLRR